MAGASNMPYRTGQKVASVKLSEQSCLCDRGRLATLHNLQPLKILTPPLRDRRTTQRMFVFCVIVLQYHERCVRVFFYWTSLLGTGDMTRA